MKKILLVEGTNILKIRLEKLMSRFDSIEVVSFGDSMHQFDLFLKKNTPFDVLIIDYEQNDTNLKSILQSLSQTKNALKPSLVMITDMVDVKTIIKYYSYGISEVILKPFTDDFFITKLMKTLSSSQDEIHKVVQNNFTEKSTSLLWSSDYEIGVPKIDSEHRVIIEHFQELYMEMKDGHGHEYYNRFLEFLESYVDYHFENEEKLQNEINYDDLKHHKELHLNFKEQVKLLVTHDENFSISNADLVKLNLFIKSWLINHILVEDKKLGNFINKSAAYNTREENEGKLKVN